MTAKLLPCPFCAAPAKLSCDVDGYAYAAQCASCRATMHGASWQDTVRRWNARAPAPLVLTIEAPVCSATMAKLRQALAAAPPGRLELWVESRKNSRTDPKPGYKILNPGEIFRRD